MSRGGSRTSVAPEGKRGVQIPKNCDSPTAYKGIVINNCYYRTLTASARVGTGNFSHWLRAIRAGKFREYFPAFSVLEEERQWF